MKSKLTAVCAALLFASTAAATPFDRLSEDEELVVLEAQSRLFCHKQLNRWVEMGAITRIDWPSMEVEPRLFVSSEYQEVPKENRSGIASALNCVITGTMDDEVCFDFTILNRVGLPIERWHNCELR